MLFAHGFGCDQNMWRYITPAFEDRYKIILFDYVGCGQSDLNAYNREKYEALEGYAQDVLDVIHELDLSNVIFVGHSVSSMIGMLADLKEPDRFAHLIMVGPSPCYIDHEEYRGGFSRKDIDGFLELMEKNYIGWATAFAPPIMKNPERPELSEELEASFCATDPVIAKYFARATFLSDNRSDLEQSHTPCLLLQCSDDIIAPNEVGEYLHRNLRNSLLVQLEATGHCPHMSHPEETIGAIKQYLERQHSR